MRCENGSAPADPCGPYTPPAATAHHTHPDIKTRLSARGGLRRPGLSRGRSTKRATRYRRCTRGTVNVGDR